MTVGLPGAGIGGLFYLLAALLMPLRELAHTVRGRSSASRWTLVAWQFAYAGGIAAGTWVTGWLIVAGATRLATRAGGSGVATGAPTRVLDLLRPAQGVATLLMLAAILAIVAIVGRVVARPVAGVSADAPPLVPTRPEGARPLALTPRPRHSLTPSASHPAWRRRTGQHIRRRPG